MPSDAYSLPAGFGLRRLPPSELDARGHGLKALMDLLLIFEPPRTRPRHRAYRYVLGVDVSDGIGQDRSVIDVLRVPTIEEPEEQVAQFVTDTTSPEDLAPIVDAIGHLYADPDGYEALAAIEINNHGKSTQDLLQKHYGYTHFYRWQYIDKRLLDQRFANVIGWATTPSTRPLLLSRGVSALKRFEQLSWDGETHLRPSLIIHSPFTYEDLADFVSPTGHLVDAEASHGKHDDCVISLFIAHYAVEQLFIGESEPIGDRRARLQAEEAARQSATATRHLDWRNTDVTADEADLGLSVEDLATLTDQDVADLVETVDERGSDYSLSDYSLSDYSLSDWE